MIRLWDELPPATEPFPTVRQRRDMRNKLPVSPASFPYVGALGSTEPESMRVLARLIPEHRHAAVYARGFDPFPLAASRNYAAPVDRSHFPAREGAAAFSTENAPPDASQ